MRYRTLENWLAFQERLHPTAIDLGLDRVRAVASAMDLLPAPCPVITVGGTNGKGSTVAFIGAMLRAAGHGVGLYTSPHLVRYNERIVVDGVEADEDALCAAFDAVDQARGDASLTYFEFGTLAAMQHFRSRGCDVVVLEVGLGGRLDATNAWDADAAVVVSVGLDHMEWLGPDRESIGFEKAGIFRGGRPAVVGETHPPRRLRAHVDAINAHLICLGEHYRYEVHADGTWDFHGLTRALSGLPAPSLPGTVQYGNAAAACATLEATGLAWDPAGLTLATLAGRFQRIGVRPDLIVDVTHNAEGARALARHLVGDAVLGRTIAVCGMMADKPVEATLQALDAVVDHWVFAGLPGPRGASGEVMAERAHAAGLHGSQERCEDVAAAVVRARALAGIDDRIVVFGSFVTAGTVLK